MIDWSDPEEMLGLLAEYLRDELQGERDDRDRAQFLRALWSTVDALARGNDASSRNTLARLQEIYDEQPHEFAHDRALTHVRDCIEELARIAGA